MRKTWVQNIRDFFLRHNDLKSVLLFILLSALMWFVLKMNKTYRTDLSVPVHYTGQGGRLLPDSLFTDTLRLEIRATGWKWLRAGFEKPELRLAFRPYTSKELTDKFVFRYFKDSNLVLKSFLIENPGRKKYTHIRQVRTNINPEIITPDGYAVRRMQVVPDTVTVLSAGKIRSPLKLSIEPATFRVHPGDSLLEFRWAQKPGRLIIPEGGKIKIKLVPFARAHTDVPVSIPPQWKNKIVILPANVRVYYKKWRSPVQDTTSWKITLDGAPNGTEKIPLRIAQKPADVFDVELRPDRVDYLQIKH